MHILLNWLPCKIVHYYLLRELLRFTLPQLKCSWLYLCFPQLGLLLPLCDFQRSCTHKPWWLCVFRGQNLLATTIPVVMIGSYLIGKWTPAAYTMCNLLLIRYTKEQWKTWQVGCEQTVACQLPRILARRLVTTGSTTILQTLDQTGWLLSAHKMPRRQWYNVWFWRWLADITARAEKNSLQAGYFE